MATRIRENYRGLMTTTLPVEPGTDRPIAAAPTSTLSIISLVSAISGIAFGLVIPLSIVAIVVGVLALSREPQSRTMAVWGIVLGAIPGGLTIIFGGLAAVLLIPFGVFAAFVGA
jgi:hypothetical protein